MQGFKHRCVVMLESSGNVIIKLGSEQCRKTNDASDGRNSASANVELAHQIPHSSPTTSGRIVSKVTMSTVTATPLAGGSKPLLQAQPSAQRLPSQATQQQHQQPQSGLRYPSNRKTIYDRNLSRTRTAELSRASFGYLFAEMVSYAQRRVTGIQDLERRYVFKRMTKFSRSTSSVTSKAGRQAYRLPVFTFPHTTCT